jgi:signal transduction histidine kinase
VILIVLILNLGIIIFLLFKVRYLNKELRELKLNKEKELARIQKEIETESILFLESEIQRIGADIHDDLIQRISEMLLLIERSTMVEDVANAQAYALQMKKHSQQVIKSLRRLSRTYLPGSIDSTSLVVAIIDLCDSMEMQGPHIARINFDSHGANFQFQGNHQAHIVRIVQELIHNAIKNGSAWHVWVNLYWEDNTLLIKVEDDGINSEALLKQAQLSGALRTLKMRNKYLGSSVVFELRSGKGLMVTLRYTDEEKSGTIVFK